MVVQGSPPTFVTDFETGAKYPLSQLLDTEGLKIAKQSGFTRRMCKFSVADCRQCGTGKGPFPCLFLHLKPEFEKKVTSSAKPKAAAPTTIAAAAKERSYVTCAETGEEFPISQLFDNEGLKRAKQNNFRGRFCNCTIADCYSPEKQRVAPSCI